MENIDVEIVRMCKAISAITIDNASVETALKIYRGNKIFYFFVLNLLFYSDLH